MRSREHGVNPRTCAGHVRARTPGHAEVSRRAVLEDHRFHHGVAIEAGCPSRCRNLSQKAEHQRQQNSNG